MPTILVVDDEAESRSILRACVEAEGVQVQEAADGTQALQKLAAGGIDAIITDLRMPQLDGMQLLAEVKQQHPHCRILMVTGMGSVKEAVNAMRLGADDFLTKPFANKLAEVRARVRSLLGLAQARQEKASATPPLAAGAAPESERRTWRFLLVEDSLMIRNFVQGTLNRAFEPCEIVTAADGREAMRAIAKERFDLIVTDLQMPGMDGKNLLEQLQGNPVLSKKPVLVLSGSIRDDLRARWSGRPVSFQAKPASREEIAIAVRKALGTV